MYFQSEDNSKQMVILRTCLVGGISLVLMLFLSIKSVVPMMEKDLLKRVSVVLLDHKLENILISAQGQDIFLEGLVDDKTRILAIDAASQVNGVRKVHDQFIITKSKSSQKSMSK